MSYRDCDVSGTIEVTANYTEEIYQELKYQNLANNLIISFKCSMAKKKVCLRYKRIDSLQVVTVDEDTHHTLVTLNSGEKYLACLGLNDFMQPIDSGLNGSINRSFPWLNLDKIAEEKKQTSENQDQC